MTATAEEDFRDFVVARWADLEPVAHLVTLDGPTARRVTTEALADLHGRWGQLVDEGMPGAEARQAVLTGALAATRHRPSARPHDHAHPGPDDDHAPVDDPDDLAVAALLPVVRRAAPLERAALAAATGLGPGPGAGRRPARDAARHRPRRRPRGASSPPRRAHRRPRGGRVGARRVGPRPRPRRGPRPAARRPRRPAGRRGAGRASATGRCAAARSCSAPGPRWPPGS